MQMQRNKNINKTIDGVWVEYPIQLRYILSRPSVWKQYYVKIGHYMQSKLYLLWRESDGLSLRVSVCACECTEKWSWERFMHVFVYIWYIILTIRFNTNARALNAPHYIETVSYVCKQDHMYLQSTNKINRRSVCQFDDLFNNLVLTIFTIHSLVSCGQNAFSKCPNSVWNRMFSNWRKMWTLKIWHFTNEISLKGY